MQIVIDIDDEQVLFDIKNHALEAESETDRVIIDALYNGTPLDDIKAEIKSELITDGQVIEGEYFSDDAENINFGLNKALEIIDKHISGKE